MNVGAILKADSLEGDSLVPATEQLIGSKSTADLQLEQATCNYSTLMDAAKKINELTKETSCWPPLPTPDHVTE